MENNKGVPNSAIDFRIPVRGQLNAVELQDPVVSILAFRSGINYPTDLEMSGRMEWRDENPVVETTMQQGEPITPVDFRKGLRGTE